MINVNGIVKKYGDHTAVDGLSFTIEPGKIYGLLGPNGAGKSTTMNVMTGNLAANAGTVTVNGYDIYKEPEKAKKCIGYLPEIPPLYPDMTPVEYLTFVASARGVEYEKISRRVKEVVEITQLKDVGNRLIRNLSKGYRQRVGIAMAMVGNPDIIILDEPTVGLDPIQIIEIRELIKKLGQTKTVILSSHILAEIEEICHHVMIISHGKLVANDTIENLKKSVNGYDTLNLTAKGDAAQVLGILDGIDAVIDAAPTGDASGGICRFDIKIRKGEDPREQIFFAMADARLPILEIKLEKITLEGVFLALTEGTAAEVSDDDDGGEYGDAPDNGKNGNDGDGYKPLFS